MSNKKKWGHQVAVRFKDLRKLDALVEKNKKSGVRPVGRLSEWTHSSVIVDLVDKAAEGLPLTGPAARDDRQLELLADQRDAKLQPAVDAVESSFKALERKSRPKKKAPRGAPKKHRAAKLLKPNGKALKPTTTFHLKRAMHRFSKGLPAKARSSKRTSKRKNRKGARR